MYAKVFEQIFDSSIAEDYEVRHVFMDLLAMADLNGVVDKTLGAVARRTNVPREIVERAIAELCKPEPESRTKVEGGRRLVLLDEHRDWGWRIVNYEFYRGIQNEEERRNAWKYSKREQRAKAKKESLNPMGQPLPGENEYVDAERAGASQEELDRIVDRQTNEDNNTTDDGQNDRSVLD